MVNQKKNAVKAKQQTPSKPKNKKNEDLEMDFSMDSDDSGSEEEQVVKKTPGGKTPKGKQQTDKRVSFQIPGKNTPASKNAKSENSLLRKQPTPGKKTNLKEFQGVLAKSPAKKNGGPPSHDDDEDDDEDDDDDDDDDDEEDDDDADLDMLLGGSDDDDDDDDDDEDEEDDDEDDDDDEQQPPQKKQKQSEKQQNAAAVQKQTPAKSNKELKQAEKQTPKQEKVTQSPSKSSTKADTPVVKKALQLEADRRKQRDVRTLFVGSLPLDVTPTELKAMSADIIGVNIPKLSSKNKRKVMFAFLEFASEEKAEENHKLLQSKKLRNQPIKVDFTGVKRQGFAADAQPEEKAINMKKLYVASLPLDATMDKVAQFFPNSFQVTLNSGFGGQRTAAVFYAEEKDAAADLEAAKSATLKGKPITVLYSMAREKTRKRKHPKSKQQQAKKVKKEVKQESDDDDDDDDDDDEDEE